MELASEVERHEKVDHQQPAVMASYIRQKSQEHAQENATILGEIPAGSIPWETLGGFGTLLGAGFALWQRSGKLHAVSVAKEVAELEPEKAKEVLKRKNLA